MAELPVLGTGVPKEESSLDVYSLNFLNQKDREKLTKLIKKMIRLK